MPNVITLLIFINFSAAFCISFFDNAFRYSLYTGDLNNFKDEPVFNISPPAIVSPDDLRIIGSLTLHDIFLSDLRWT